MPLLCRTTPRPELAEPWYSSVRGRHREGPQGKPPRRLRASARAAERRRPAGACARRAAAGSGKPLGAGFDRLEQRPSLILRLLIPETQYVKTPDGAHIAYQVFGSGPRDLVCVPGFASNVEHMWRLPPFASAYRRLASFARVIVFDRCGTGLSHPNLTGANLPTLEARMDDIRAVMDAAEVERAAPFGDEDGALLCAVFAATHPSRSFAAVLHGTGPRGSWAPDYPCGLTAEQWDEYLTRVDDSWGTEAFTQYMIEEAWSSHVGDVDFRQEFASFLRVSASPGAAVVFESLYRETDIRDVLGTIQMPVLVMHSVGSRVESIECARYLAAHIPGARLVELPGDEHFPFAGNQAQTLLETIERFLTSIYGDDEEIDRVLAHGASYRCRPLDRDRCRDG